MKSIDKILLDSATFADQQETNNFIGKFKELYKISLFKIGLDAILTKAELGNVKFILEHKNKFERLHGCCISSSSSKFNKIFKVFTKELNHQIKIQTLEPHVLAHEITHALEKESKLDMRKDFSTALKIDMQHVKNSHILVQRAIKQILFKELELYPQKKHDSELLARYFELLARSKEIGGYSDNFHYHYHEIINIFPNATSWVENIFNESLKASVREHIAQLSSNIKYDSELNNFSRKAKKIHGNKQANWRKATNSLFSSSTNYNIEDKNHLNKIEEE